MFDLGVSGCVDKLQVIGRRSAGQNFQLLPGDDDDVRNDDGGDDDDVRNDDGGDGDEDDGGGNDLNHNLDYDELDNDAESIAS